MLHVWGYSCWDSRRRVLIWPKHVTNWQRWHVAPSCVSWVNEKSHTWIQNCSTGFSKEPVMSSSWAPQAGRKLRADKCQGLRRPSQIVSRFKTPSTSCSGFWLASMSFISVSLVLNPWSSHFWKETQGQFLRSLWNRDEELLRFQNFDFQSWEKWLNS